MAPTEAFKARNMRVYMSGFHGLHRIEVAVAYWHRGHYIYGPARNPIEPLQFSTKKELMIIGTTADTAPIYTLDGRDLVLESDVGALRKAMLDQFMRQKMSEPHGDGATYVDQNTGMGGGNRDRIIEKPHSQQQGQQQQSVHGGAHTQSKYTPSTPDLRNPLMG